MTTPISPKARILVVDDEALVCDSIRRMLEFFGHDARVANSAREALSLFDKDPFDLVLIDFAMPETRGDELAIALKSRLANQPVGLISASAELLKLSGNPLTGVDFILGKPIELEQLRTVVAKFLPKGSPAR